MPHYHIWTIGCQMNKAESKRLAGLFLQREMQATEHLDEADVIILNTCVVRQHAEERAVNKMRSLAAIKKLNPKVTVAVTGCWVNNPERHKREFPYIDYFFKAGEAPPWAEKQSWALTIPEQSSIATYVPIIQGCNNYCSYCIVPYRRGREKSRPLNEVLCAVRELVKRGTREVTLIGQNVDSYGHDLPGQPELADLLTEINQIAGLWRIRFLTNHPKDMDLRLIDTIAKLDKVCPAFNIPAQSGSNEILSAMHRGYSVEEYHRLINLIRNKIDGVALSSDVIVGFPTETEAQFQETLNLLNDVRFDTVHVAMYSPRAGTLAAREMIDDVPVIEKKRRLQIVEKRQETIAACINASLQGTSVEVLVESKEGQKWQGRSKTDKIVFFKDDTDWYGKLVKIKIEYTSPWSLQGSVIGQKKEAVDCIRNFH